MRLRIVGPALTAALALTAPAQATAGRAAPPCHDVAFSPDFSRDRTMFCAYDVPYDAAYVARSTDGGRTWGNGVEVAASQLAATLWVHIAVSPWYAHDGRLLVTTATGLFESTDRGRTFRAVGPESNHGPHAHRVTPFLDPLVNPLEPRPAFVYARPGQGAFVYHPQGGTRPVRETALDDAQVFLVPPDYARKREAVVLAGASLAAYNSGRPVGNTGLAAYTCVGDFVCEYRHFDFGDAFYVYSAPLGRPGSLLLVTGDKTAGADHNVWRTDDYGRTWKALPWLQRLVPPVSHESYGGDVVVTASPDAPRRLFMHVVDRSDGPDPNRMDDDPQRLTLYRSDDDGATWRTVGQSSSAARGSLPWNHEQWFKPITLSARPGGRLYATAAHRTSGRVDYQGIFCSPDLGRTWRRGSC